MRWKRSVNASKNFSFRWGFGENDSENIPWKRRNDGHWREINYNLRCIISVGNCNRFFGIPIAMLENFIHKKEKKKWLHRYDRSIRVVMRWKKSMNASKNFDFWRGIGENDSENIPKMLQKYRRRIKYATYNHRSRLFTLNTLNSTDSTLLFIYPLLLPPLHLQLSHITSSENSKILVCYLFLQHPFSIKLSKIVQAIEDANANCREILFLCR